MPKIVDHDARRAEIVDALWRVVERDGANAVSVRSVAAEAGMSKTGMAHYFSSGNELLAVAVERTIAEVSEQAAHFDVDTLDPKRAAQAIALLIPSGAKRRQRALVWLALLSAATHDDDARKVLDELNRTTRNGILTVVEALKANGFVAKHRNVATEAALLHGLVDGLSIQTLTDPRFMPGKEIDALVLNQLKQLAN